MFSDFSSHCYEYIPNPISPYLRLNMPPRHLRRQGTLYQTANKTHWAGDEMKFRFKIPEVISNIWELFFSTVSYQQMKNQWHDTRDAPCISITAERGCHATILARCPRNVCSDFLMREMASRIKAGSSGGFIERDGGKPISGLVGSIVHLHWKIETGGT